MTTDKGLPDTTTIRVDRLTRKRLRHLAASWDCSLMTALCAIVARAYQDSGMEEKPDER